jgi:hypothetical protein
MDLPFLLAVIFAFVLAKNVLESRAKVHAERSRLLEKALQQQVDPKTLEGLAWQLTGRRNPAFDRDALGRRWRALLLAVGWFTMFGGAAAWIAGGITGAREAIVAGIVLLLSGFAITTYPFALRELENRREPRSGQ